MVPESVRNELKKHKRELHQQQQKAKRLEAMVGIACCATFTDLLQVKKLKGELHMFEATLKNKCNSCSFAADEKDCEVASIEQTSELLPLVKRVLREKPEWIESFNYVFVKSQLENILSPDGRGVRWNAALLNFAMSIQFYGGQRVLDLLIGHGHGTTQRKCGSLPRDVPNFNLFLPSNSTVRGYTSFIDPYENSDEMMAKKLACMFEKAGLPREGGIVTDEIDIRSGVIFLKSSGQLLGLEHLLSVYDVNHSTKDTMEGGLAKKVLQFFFVDNTGNISIPMGYLPTVGATGKFLFDSVKAKIEMLGRTGIDVTWGSSDAFSGSSEFVSLMATYKPSYYHFYDFVHTVKSGRNQLINRQVAYDNIEFSMQHVYDLWEKFPAFSNAGISFDDIHPSDKQCLKHVMNLVTQHNLFSSIKNPQYTQKAKAIGFYLKFFCDYYELFNNNDTPMDLKHDIARRLLKESYLLRNVTEQLREQLEVTLKNFHSFFSQRQLQKTSIFGTNIVENFFSIIRAKIRCHRSIRELEFTSIRYPNLFEYGCVYSRAWIELVKRFSLDCSYSFPAHQVGSDRERKYNDQNGWVRYQTA